MPEISAQPNQPAQPQVQPEQGKGISWKKIAISVVVILVVAGIIASGLYWFFVLNEEETTTTEPVKVSTPSSKQATPSSKKETPSAEKEKDETAGWKTLVTRTAESNPDIYDPTKTIKFSFKYPADFREVPTEGSSVVTNDPNFQLGLKTVGTIGANSTIGGTKPTSYTKFTLGGKVALRGSETWWGRGSEPTQVTITYYLSSVTTEEGNNVDFSLRCYYLPKTGINAEKTCDLIASTFKFLE
jgi:hypothetical protein